MEPPGHKKGQRERETNWEKEQDEDHAEEQTITVVEYVNGGC